MDSPCLVAAVLVTLLMPEPPGRDRHTHVLASMRGSIDIVWRRPVLRWNFVNWYLIRGGGGVIDTYLPLRITELVPDDPAPAIGLVLGGYGLLTTIATWLSGRFVDRIGPARLFWPVMIVACGASIGIATAPFLWLLTLSAWIRSVPVALDGNRAVCAPGAGVRPGRARAGVVADARAAQPGAIFGDAGRLGRGGAGHERCAPGWRVRVRSGGVGRLADGGRNATITTACGVRKWTDMQKARTPENPRL